MTNFEQRQPNRTFVAAGRRAFMIGVHINDCPYTTEPHKKLWAEGHRSAKQNPYLEQPLFRVADLGKKAFAEREEVKRKIFAPRAPRGDFKRRPFHGRKESSGAPRVSGRALPQDA